jgi:DNA polymerase elongation subunit (family B)
VDIETSPALVYAYGLFDQNISISQIVEPSRMLCFAAKWHDTKRVEFYSEHHDGREEMVRQAWRLLDEAEIVIGYNHVRFDIPHLNREFLLAGLGPPSPWVDVDLLTINRRRFKFMSNKLGYVTDAVGLPTKLDTGGQSLWNDVLKGNERAWAKFKRYNMQDVRITEQLYDLLRPWIKHPHMGQWTGSAYACHSCGGRDLVPVGIIHTNLTAYPKALCSCGALNRILSNGKTRAA